MGITRTSTQSATAFSQSRVRAGGYAALETAAGLGSSINNVFDFGEVNRYAGVDPTGVADSVTGINRAVTSLLATVYNRGTYKTATTPTGAQRAIVIDSTFTGAAPANAWIPAFGGVFQAWEQTGQNAIVGAVNNTKPASTLALPCGITGYGRVNNTGNACFGSFGRADLNGATGVACNEFDAFNNSGIISTTAYPPNRGIGTTDVFTNALYLGAGGNQTCSIALEIGKEGSTFQKWKTALYLDPGAFTQYGIFLDALSTDTHVPFVVKHAVATLAFQLQGVGTPSANSAWLQYTDGAAAIKFSIKQDGHIAITSGIQTLTATAGTNGATPAQVQGYMNIEVDGFVKKIPYYNP